MDDQKILDRAMTWMRNRNWREKVAKSSSGQSLYQHALIELDFFLQILPLLRNTKRYGFTDLESWILVVALIVHDVGKETEEWQQYVMSRGPVNRVSHIQPELLQQVVPDICIALEIEDLSEDVHQVIAQCAEIHHDRPGRSDRAIFKAILTDVPARFVTLANLVKAIDHVCSAEAPGEAVLALEREESLRRHVRATFHEVTDRGVSTVLLHRASHRCYSGRGWLPLLYFSQGTVYAADLQSDVSNPSAEDIADALRSELDDALKRDLTSLMVGSPVGNMLPKPELVSFSETREYLAIAGSKISPRSFAKKKADVRYKVAAAYLTLRGELNEKVTDDDLERVSGRISIAQPEMLVFKFFKAMLDPDKIPAVGCDGADLARRRYETIFGEGAWSDLQSTSTLMAAKDMFRTVDRYWRLPGTTVRHEAARVEQIDDKERLARLIELLADIATEVYKSIERPSPRDALASQMTQSFMTDLLKPRQGAADIKGLARAQMAHYRQSKPNAGKDITSAIYICPICSKPFRSGQGKKASADFIDNPQTHTNRGVSHGSFGYVMVCDACYHERMLRQLLMGGAFAELIKIAPALNFGPVSGSTLVRTVRQWTDAANNIGSLEFGFSLSFTDQTARQLEAHDPFELEPEELIRLFRFRYTAKTQKRRYKEILDALNQAFDSDLILLNAACEGSFENWDQAVKAVIAGSVDQDDFRSIRQRVLGSDTVGLLPQTPNTILIPLRREIASGDDESQPCKAIRRLYVALILSTVFDASVAISRNADVSDLPAGRGAAFVPPVAALRALVNTDWIPINMARYWIGAVGAASVLARAHLPGRSGLYQALTIDPAEKLLRKIESHGATASPLDMNLIAQLPGFHTN